jgi:hypothetical protein
VPPNVPKAVLNAAPSMLSVARLKPGVSLASGNANVDVVLQRLDAANPGGKTGRSGLLVSIQDDVVRQFENVAVAVAGLGGRGAVDRVRST